MGERARVRLIRAAQSDELRATFRQLAEIDGPRGPKFPRRVLLELAARIVGRAYEPMLLELCHLARAAQLAGEAPPGGRRGAGGGAGGAGFEWLFWGVEEARAGAFRAAFCGGGSSLGGDSPTSAVHEFGDEGAVRLGAAEAGALHAGDDAVVLAYPDGRFELRYGRMVDLAAMMELVVSTLGYRALVEALDPLAAPAAGRGAVAGAARDLARRLYEWLGDRLPTAQAQRKFHAMVAFLEEARGADFTEEDIDDEAILRFWLRQVTPSGGEAAAGRASAGSDFRGYRNTFLAFIALARVLAEGEALGRFDQHAAIGSDFEAGEVDPAAEAATAAMAGAAGADEDDPIVRLQEEPAAAVKALNRRELALLQLPVGESGAVRRLPRSYLRAECFGPVQNRLSQGLRRKAGAAELAALVAAGPDPGYRAQIDALEKADAHVRRVARACLYVLHRMGGAGTGGGARGGEPRAGTGNADGGGRDGDGDGGSGQLGGGGDAAGDAAVPALDFRLLGEARKAFEGLNRAGFERSAPTDPDLAPAYAALADELPRVSERLGAVLRGFGPAGAWEDAEEEDRPVFARTFTRLYGAATNESPEDRDEVTRGRDSASGESTVFEDGSEGGGDQPGQRQPEAARSSAARPVGGRP